MKRYQIEIRNRLASMENLSGSQDMNSALENIKENTKTSAIESLGLYELKKNEPCFDEECLRFLDQMK